MQPKYKTVKDEIKSWLMSDKFSPHDKLPTETQLMEKFHVSRHTIRRAIGDLEVEHYLYRIQGGGMYVANWREKQETQTLTKTIAVLTTHIADYIFPSIIVGIEKVLSEHSFSLLLSSTHHDILLERKSLENLLSHPIEGIIVEPTKSSYPSQNIGFYKNLEKSNVPCVMIHSTYQDTNFPSLTMDDTKGGYMATEHLLSLGHRKILGIFKTDDHQGLKRMNGFISAYQQNPSLAVPGDFITYGTNEEKKELPQRIKASLTSSNRPTGIVCYNDQVALTVMSIAKELGLSIPEDLSVVGYDDSQVAKIVDVKLTTIKHPKEQMGIDAANMILKLIEAPLTKKVESIVYPPELVIRESTKEIKN
ncbi:GntR family transcriptional regulator [Bacillus sp. JZ8]